jgi:hypothetical protein
MKIFGYFPPAKYDFLLDFNFSLIYIGMAIHLQIEEEVTDE